MFHIDNEVLEIFSLLFELFKLHYIVAYHEAIILLLLQETYLANAHEEHGAISHKNQHYREITVL